MGVFAEVLEFNKEDFFPGGGVKSSFVKKILYQLNALYEACLSGKAPKSFIQTFSGHDHGEEGGGALVRSSVLTLDQFSRDLWSATFTSLQELKTGGLGPRYISPLLGSETNYTDVMISVKVEGGSVDLWAGLDNTNKVRVDPTNEGDTYFYKWVALKNTIIRSGQFSDLIISAQPTDFQGEEVTVAINCLDEAETTQLSLPELGVRNLPESVGQVGEVLKYFGDDAPLDDVLVEELEALDAYTLKIIVWALNALFELTLDRTAPGSDTHHIKGHDHTFQGLLDNQGGRPVPRGLIYCAGGVDQDAWLNCSLSVVNQWEYADKDIAVASLRRTTGSPNATTGLGSTASLFDAYVSSGFSSSGNPPSSAPWLCAYCYVTGGTPGDTVGRIRIFNQSTSTLSPEVNVPLDSWFLITKIPCIGNQWNEFDIQVRRVAGGTTTGLKVVGFRLFEVSEVDGEQAAYISSGSRQIGGNRGGTIKRGGDGPTGLPPIVVP